MKKQLIETFSTRGLTLFSTNSCGCYGYHINLDLIEQPGYRVTYEDGTSVSSRYELSKKKHYMECKEGTVYEP